MSLTEGPVVVPLETPILLLFPVQFDPMSPSPWVSQCPHQWPLLELVSIPTSAMRAGLFFVCLISYAHYQGDSPTPAITLS